MSETQSEKNVHYENWLLNIIVNVTRKFDDDRNTFDNMTM